MNIIASAKESGGKYYYINASGLNVLFDQVAESEVSGVVHLSYLGAERAHIFPDQVPEFKRLLAAAEVAA